MRLVSADGLNRLSLELLEELAAAPRIQPHASRFIITGNARCFSAGADLAAIVALDGPSAFGFARRGQAALNAIEQSPVPFIAAVEGACLGGGLDLALACRARVCSPEAYFGHHGVKLGLVTGWGGTQRLPRLIGVPHTLQHLICAEGWTPAAALAEGLVLSIEKNLLAAALNAVPATPPPHSAPAPGRG